MPKTIFDHIKHIKWEKSKDYYTNLADEDITTFNKFIILRGLSMDKTSVDNIALISKYMDIIPNEQFYKLCCDLTPKNRTYFPWIKSDGRKINRQILSIVSKYYSISMRESYEYCSILLEKNEGIQNIIDIFKMYGHSEDEIEKIFNE